MQQIDALEGSRKEKYEEWSCRKMRKSQKARVDE